ncbi:uncharacterized protein LOC121424803 isoform X1 [Lytechinus variegatus]|uniref:uncharacterized protein LOC121424803 isoform X1 n=1 Tax=Lytechinus variegatus TaxID=7654 RepID=UPI001BB2ABE9|nr:uncharacterized protein LOC121424803 isoform X1 [Lytechinus variegatus]
MNEPKSPSTKETEHYRLIEESDGENEVDLLDEQEDATEEMESCTTQTGELEVLATMETEHDRLMEESDEDNEVDLLDEQEDTTEETDRRRKETLESNNEGRNKEKTEEFDRDTQYEIDYFQEIAESMKVFASMMVDMKIVKVEIKGIKEMLKALAGKVECVIEGRAQNEQQRLREKRNTGRIVKDNLLARRRKYMHGKGIRKFDSRRLMMSKNVVNGKSDEVERRQTVEATGRVFTKNTSGDGHRDGVHEKHGERIDALRKMPEKNLVETRNDVSRVMTQDNLGNLNREDMNVSGGEDKMMTEKNLDGMRDSIMHDHETSNNNDGQNENCAGIESLQESDDEDVGTVDVFFDGGSDSEEDSLGAQDECARSKDYDSVESCKREKNDRSIASSRLSQQDEESFAQGVVNEEVAKPQENFRWEKLPEGKINRLRSLPIGRFALEIVKNLVRSDILMKSNCTGKHTSTTSIPHVQAIDPGILEYALETTYKVFDVEEREKHRVRRECVSTIDSHCRYLRKVARRAPRKSAIEKGRIGANQEERLPGNDSIACLPTEIAPVPVEERHLEEQAITESKKNEISEEKGSRRKMPKNSCGQTDGEDDQTGMLGNDKVNEDTELDNRRHDCARNSDEQDASVITGKGRQYGIEEWALKGLPLKKLTDVDISNFKSHFRSAAAFATHAITHIVSDRVLINSNCFGKTRSDSGRPNVQPIDPDILAYVIETTFDAYGIEEQDYTKCRKECFMAIDSHCRDLFASSKRRKTGCASGMQRNVMKQIDGECGSGEKIGRKEGSSATNSEGFKEVMSEESTGIKSTCHSLADKDIARVKGSGPTLPKFVARVLRLFLTDDILAISNCSGKSSSGRPNIQRIDPNIVAYILETVYDVYDVDEFDKADFRRKCIIAIDQCCRNEKKKRCKKGTATSSVNGNVRKRKGTKIQSEKEQEESV